MSDHLYSDELMSIRELIVMMHTEIHNPGAKATTDPWFDFDDETEDALRRIDHVLRAIREKVR